MPLPKTLAAVLGKWISIEKGEITKWSVDTTHLHLDISSKWRLR